MKTLLIGTCIALSMALSACSTTKLQDARQNTAGLEQAKAIVQENLAHATTEANIVHNAEKATLQSAKADKQAEKARKQAEKAQRKADRAQKRAEKRAKQAEKRAKRAEAKAKKAQAKIQKAEELLNQ